MEWAIVRRLRRRIDHQSDWAAENDRKSRVVAEMIRP